MSALNVPNPSPVTVAQGKKAPGRRGPKGYFKGSRKIFLDSQVSAYTASKKGTRQNFWHRLYSTWWQRYPWKLADNEEPPTDDPAKMARLGSVAPGEQTLKGEVERSLTNRLSQWFVNRATANSDQPGPLAWLPLLQRLHQIRNTRPRQRTTIQQFMSDHADIINATFLHRHGDGRNLTSAQKMNTRHDLAKGLLVGQYSHLVSGLDKKATDKHDADVREWNLILDDISSAQDISQARDSLFDAVHPLLQAIGSYANCYVSLIAGNPETDETEKGFFTAVHWSPGGPKSAKDWTEWDKDGFNSGVAGPFLTYAGESNKALKREDGPPPAIQAPQSPPTVPNTISVDNGTQPPDIPPAHVQSPITTTALRANYRPLPAKTKSSIPTLDTNKRKRALKSRPTRYFEDTSSESDEVASLSGDGSSSGDSALPDTPASAKRPRVSTVITRSSTKTLATDLGTQDTQNPSSPVLTIVQPSSAVPGADTDAPADRGLDTPPADAPADTMDVDISLSESGVVPVADTEATGATEAKITPATGTELVIEPGSIAGVPPITIATTPPLNVIDIGKVPAFLRSHGKGNRRVDIFKYLDEVQDPRFQQVLLHYINFEINDKSGVHGSLPTTNRPIEISQWSSRARPANLLNYTKGKRTFPMFVDSVFAWWGSLQPSWRSFQRDEVSREVQGGWEVLHAPRINGLLNVVMLVYWWAQALEEQDPTGGARADYELFADDVAWVFAQLST